MGDRGHNRHGPKRGEGAVYPFRGALGTRFHLIAFHQPIAQIRLHFADKVRLWLLILERSKLHQRTPNNEGQRSSLFVDLSSRCIVLVKFHYAIWSQTSPKLVVDRFAAGRRPAASRNLAYHLARAAGLRPASNLSATR